MTTTTELLKALADRLHAPGHLTRDQAEKHAAVALEVFRAQARNEPHNGNDKEPRDPESFAYLDRRGDDEGHGLDSYWKWGYAAGWNDHKRHAPVEQVPEVLAWRAARREAERTTEAYNAALIEARAQDEVVGFGRTSVDAEFQAMTRAGNAVVALVRPMLAALDKR